MADYKTSKSDFEYYKKMVKFYLQKFGLMEFEVDFVYRDLKDAGEPLCNSCAGIIISTNGRAATFFLNQDWGIDIPNKVNLERSAIHEVTHLLLGEFSCLANARFINEEQLNVVEHTIIRRLENFILGYKNGIIK